MGGEEIGTTPVPTDQRRRVLRDQALLQQPRQPQPPHPRLRPVMQQPPQRGAALPPQGFIGAGMPSPQGIGSSLASAAAVQAQAMAEEAARTRAAEQMAFEDAWKALNPDFRTPFASVEDAVSRLLPYHVFADSEEADDVIDVTSGGNSSVTENSSSQKWEEDMGARVDVSLEHFEKQVLSFNIMTQHRAAGLNRTEERLLLERALHDDERRQVERLHAVIAQHQQREHQEAMARARQALAQAQAQAAGAWPAVQPAALWQALAAAAVRGEGVVSHAQAAAAAPGVAMQQKQETLMTAGAWQALAAAAAPRGEGGSDGQALVQAVMMQHMQRQRQQQQQQEEMVAAASRGGEGAPGGHAAMMQFMQQQNQQRQHEEMMAAASRAEVAPGELAMAPATLLRQLQLQQQQLDQLMAASGWQMGGRQMYAATRGDGGSTSSQAAFAHAHALLQQQPGTGQEQGHGSGAVAGKALLPWRGSAE